MMWLVDRVMCFIGLHAGRNLNILDKYFDGRYHFRCEVCRHEFVDR